MYNIEKIQSFASVPFQMVEVINPPSAIEVINPSYDGKADKA